MHLSLFRILFLCILSTVSTISYGNTTQVYSPMDEVTVSLLTASSGDELYSTFGHTAIRVQDFSMGTDEVYNYGMFDFRTPNFYPKFLRGQLPYYVSKSSYRRFLYAYEYEERTVWEQKLKLSADQKKGLLRFLNDNLRPENKFYKYDFLLDNCTTRAHDAIASVAEVRLPLDTLQPFRYYLKQHLKGYPWTEFGIDLVLGAPTDRIPSGENRHFLPVMLMDAYVDTKNSQDPLAEKTSVVLDFHERDQERKTDTANIPLWIFMGLLLLELILFVKKLSTGWEKIYDRILYICIGIASIIILALWFFTDHKATKENWNILWASPIFFIRGFTRDKVRYGLSIFLGLCFILAAANTIYQFLPQYFHIAILPLSLALFLNTLRNLKGT